MLEQLLQHPPVEHLGLLSKYQSGVGAPWICAAFRYDLGRSSLRLDPQLGWNFEVTAAAFPQEVQRDECLRDLGTVLAGAVGLTLMRTTILIASIGEWRGNVMIEIRSE